MTMPKSPFRPVGGHTIKVELPLRRCENCNRQYKPARKDQRFCRLPPDIDKCRKEFYRYGSSYGPLKTGLQKVIAQKVAELHKQIVKQFRAELRAELVPILTMINQADIRHERHVHEVSGDAGLITCAPALSVPLVAGPKK